MVRLSKLAQIYHSENIISRCTQLLSNWRHVEARTREFGSSAGFLSISSAHQDASRIRNIGIIAHIDAGKTTTTERMLYYSGHTRRIGDVDDGSTVTDFLPAERARGITIQSAAITFHWPPKKTGDAGDGANVVAQIQQRAELKSAFSHQINLIDTPGHADFTFEVRRSLRILDGAICILDGVAGVEAQTEQVWKQAAQWRIPRIAYVNKLDRDGAAFGRTVREVGMRLGGWPAVCQIPWWEGGKGRFTGIADVVHLRGLLYEAGGDGKHVRSFSFVELGEVNRSLTDELKRARIALVELLSEHDDLMVEAFLQADEDHLAVTPSLITDSLRRLLLTGNDVIPIFAGASFRNIGVQPLLDAVVNLLPSPEERPDPEISVGNTSGNLRQFLQGDIMAMTSSPFKSKHKRGAISAPKQTSLQGLEGCALAFKVVNDPRKGVLVYIRVYSGAINRNAMLFNTNLKVAEKASTLLRMYASESVSVQSIEAGQIGVIAGSKFARTGDTLVAYHGNKASPPLPLDTLQLRPIDVPPPVFFASIEPHSLREERDVHQKLSLLLREDPSLQVTSDPDTGQTLLSGMGELHLEIACDRLVSELKAKASMGKIAIGYRESLNTSSEPVTKLFDRDRSDAKGKAGCSVIVTPVESDISTVAEDEMDNIYIHRQDGNLILITAPSLDDDGRPISSESTALPSNLTLSDVQTAYLNGALAALGRGPKYSYPMRDTKVVISLDPALHIFGNESTISALTSAARLATVAALKDAATRGGTTMMEPVMHVDITVDEAGLGSVAQDISSSRGGHIVSLGDDTQSNDAADRPTIDVNKIYAPRDPFESDGSLDRESGQVANLTRTLTAKVPLKEMVGYLKHLRSITGGRGTFVMNIDKFERMTSQREKAAVAELQGTG